MTNNGIQIRSAESKDADAVTAMWKEMAVQHSAYDNVRWGCAKEAEVAFRKHFLATLGKEQAVMLVAVDGSDSVVGYLTGSIAQTNPCMSARCKGDINDMFVTSNCRGHGVGKALFEAAADLMKQQGAVYVTLLVAAANANAIGFYERLGLSPIGHQMCMRL
ncbi:MAG: GNAT family N-acetyltransferase [Phycisphaerae bacterium]|jgi:ribosomal protein S18 acetylase RimI-like enzyme